MQTFSFLSNHHGEFSLARSALRFLLLTHVQCSQYGEPASQNTVDPYSDAYNAPPSAPAANDRDSAAPRGRSRSRSPEARSNGEKSGYKSPSFRRRSPPPRRPPHAPVVSFSFLILYLATWVMLMKPSRHPLLPTCLECSA